MGDEDFDSKTNEPKRVFEYDNYREFLRDFYRSAKSKEGKFSFRFFSRIAGFKSPNFLKRVIDGESNLSKKSAQKFAAALKLTKEETHYFKELVLFNQAKNDDARALHAREIVKSRSRQKIQPMREAQFEFFTHWFYVAIRELVGLPGFREDPLWIASRLRPRVSPDDVKRALEVLLRLGLIARDSQGNLIQENPQITTADEVASSALAQGHRQIIGLAADAIGRFPAEKRDISAVSFSSSPATTQKIKQAVHEFRERVLEIAAEDSSPDRVYQLNLQLFPIAELKDEESTR